MKNNRSIAIEITVQQAHKKLHYGDDAN